MKRVRETRAPPLAPSSVPPASLKSFASACDCSSSNCCRVSSRAYSLRAARLSSRLARGSTDLRQRGAVERWSGEGEGEGLGEGPGEGEGRARFRRQHGPVQQRLESGGERHGLRLCDHGRRGCDRIRRGGKRRGGRGGRGGVAIGGGGGGIEPQVESDVGEDDDSLVGEIKGRLRPRLGAEVEGACGVSSWGEGVGGGGRSRGDGAWKNLTIPKSLALGLRGERSDVLTPGGSRQGLRRPEQSSKELPRPRHASTSLQGSERARPEPSDGPWRRVGRRPQAGWRAPFHPLPRPSHVREDLARRN